MKKENDEFICEQCNTVLKTIFKKLLPEELDYINKQKICQQYKRGSTIYSEGSRINGVYCICDGIIKIYKTGREGKEQIIRFAKNGDITGYRSVISGEPACTSAKVIENTTVCFIYTKDLYHLLRNNAEVGIEMLHRACSELGEANNYITDIAQKAVRERLAEVLIDLRNKFGLNEAGILNINLTREEMANLVGTATECVIRLLSEFKNDNLIALHGRRIEIINEAKLKHISNFK